MKTKLFILLKAALLPIMIAMLSGCENVSVGVVKYSDNSKFTLEFQTLNTSEYHTFELAEGDEIEAEINLESGDISLTVQKGKDDPIYEGAEPPSETFRIGINESGAYRVTVTGNDAKGSAKFNVIRNNQ